MKNQINLTNWLKHELKARGWSAREVARRAGLSHTTVSDVLSGQRKPTFEFVSALAKGLQESRVKLFRLAELLRPNEDITLQEARESSAQEEDSLLLDLMNLVKQLPDQDRKTILYFAEFLYKRRT